MLSTEADVQRISAVGILADVGFGCTKLGVGTACASPALVADGAHSLADVLVGAVSYGAYAAARAPPDDHHPYGHGKFEAGGSLVVGGFEPSAARHGGLADGRSAMAHQRMPTCLARRRRCQGRADIEP